MPHRPIYGPLTSPDEQSQVATFLESQGVRPAMTLDVSEEWIRETLQAADEAERGMNVSSSFKNSKNAMDWLENDAPKVWGRS